ncbi:GH25 family lysozyme, partial [Ligilactobacillus salivarius]|uniref:GH25 family lysozyme n=1 Tax=Ligilactobacillus salivarius TaxID=1624 RepID=UPI00321A42C7
MNWLDLLAEALRKLTTKELPGMQKQMYAYIDSKHRETIEYIDNKLNNNTPTNPDTPKPQHIGKIIDVSEWQGVIDWNKVIADDVTLSIIRVQHGSAHQDLKYMENLQQCISAGGKYAVYAYFA